VVSRRAFIVDTETTSLAPDYDGGTGVIWELAAVERGTGKQWLWRMEPDLAKADPGALRVNRYYERTRLMKHVDGRVHDLAGRAMTRSAPWTDPKALAPVIARLLDDATVICAVPTFDGPFLASFLRAYGHAPTWHYRMRDFGSMAWGWLEGRPGTENLPLDAGTDDFARALGVDPDQFDRHSALGDCLLLNACIDVMEGGE
jgi:hypothetical protein